MTTSLKTPNVNPRFTIVDHLVKREQALMRSLRMAGDSQPVKKVTLENQRRLERSAAKDFIDDDELLA